MNTNLTRTAIRLCAVIVFLSWAALVTASPKPPAPPKNATTVDLLVPPGTPPCPEPEVEVTGIYQDGLGTYQYGKWTTGAFMFHPPACAEGREINALLPIGATGAMPPGEWASCSGFSLNTPMLRIPSLLSAQNGVIDQDAGFDGVKYAFHIDTDGDGQFETPANIFWHAGIHVTRSELINPNRTVFVLTTELSSDFAEVRSNGATIGTFCIPLRLTVTRMK